MLQFYEDHILERFFDRKERDLLFRLRSELSKLPVEEASAIAREALRRFWDNESDYIQNTHFINSKHDGIVLFRWNSAQKKLYEVICRIRAEGRAVEVVILKARQIGFTTFSLSWQYEQADRYAAHAAMILSYGTRHVNEIASMAKTINSRQPAARRFSVESKTDGFRFEPPHDSRIVALTGGSENVGRGYTAHNIHISELPMWETPEASLLSALNASVLNEYADEESVKRASIIHEFTAKGAVGEAYRLWRAAERGESTYVPFFAPWFWHDNYTAKFHSEDHRNLFMRDLPREDVDYGTTYGLPPERLLWRARTIEKSCGGSRKMFAQEYPATPREAFIASGAAAFDQEAISFLSSIVKPPQFYGTILVEK